jgi:prophage regulatory protein
MTISECDRFVRLKEVCDRIGLGKSTIYRLIGSGNFPAGHIILGRYRVWLESEISTWMADQVHGVG